MRLKLNLEIETEEKIENIEINFNKKQHIVNVVNQVQPQVPTIINNEPKEDNTLKVIKQSEESTETLKETKVGEIDSDMHTSY